MASIEEQREPADERQVFGVGDAMDWNADWRPVVLWVELPFWLMVPDCSLQVDVAGHRYKVDVRNDFSELHAHEVAASRQNCFYVGTLPAQLERETIKDLEEQRPPVLPR